MDASDQFTHLEDLIANLDDRDLREVATLIGGVLGWRQHRADDGPATLVVAQRSPRRLDD